MAKRLMLLTLIPAAVLAQPAVITNYFDSNGVFQGAVNSTPYGGTVYGPGMQIEGYFTSSSPVPAQPSVTVPVQPESSWQPQLEVPTLEPLVVTPDLSDSLIGLPQ